jgi:hypothetical protein
VPVGLAVHDTQLSIEAEIVVDVPDNLMFQIVLSPPVVLSYPILKYSPPLQANVFAVVPVLVVIVNAMREAYDVKTVASVCIGG